jgi:predicted ATPase
MYLRSFSIRNFKIHRETSLTLHPISVFVGPNSGGKSAIFDALINFSMVCRGNLSEAFNQFPFSFEGLRHHGASTAARIRYEARMSQSREAADELSYLIEFSQNPGTHEEPTYTIHNEELRMGNRVLFSRSDDRCNLEGLTNLRFDGRSIFAAIRRAEWSDQFRERLPLVAHCAKEISRIGRYRLDPSLLARPGRVFDVGPGGESEGPLKTPWLSYQGEDLSSVLYFLSETESPVLQQITDRVAEAIQGFAGFEFNRVGVDRVGFSARFADRREAVVAPNLSDGCRSMIGLVTLALTPGRPAVLCIEEPENGLTPKATRVLYSTLRELARGPAEAQCQILLSSHSPFVIVDAWNGPERDFIYQCHPAGGEARIERFADLAPQGGMLRSDGTIGLSHAEQIMDGFRYQPEADVAVNPAR